MAAASVQKQILWPRSSEGGIRRCELSHVSSGQRERGMACAASFQRSFPLRLEGLFLISWNDNGPLSEWKFSCALWLCPSFQELPPSETAFLQQDWDSGSWQGCTWSFFKKPEDSWGANRPCLLGLIYFIFPSNRCNHIRT